MKNLLKLTGAPHPDVNSGKPSPIYIDAALLVSIECTRVGYTKEGSLEEMRKLTENLARSLRTAQASGRLKFEVKSEDEAQVTTAIIAELVSAFNALLQSRQVEPETYPRVDCTMITLSAGVGTYGQLWKTFFVTESPEEIARLVRVW